MLTLSALRREGLDDQALVAAYKNLFGFDVPQLPVGPGAADTEERQRVRRRVYEEVRPYLRGEMFAHDETTSTPMPGVRA
jgi:hypothetical protein